MTFHRIDDRATRIMLQLEVEPEGLVEKAGDLLGVVRRQAAADLKRFKSYIEEQGEPSGRWVGDVDRPAS